MTMTAFRFVCAVACALSLLALPLPTRADVGRAPVGLEDLNAAGADLWIYNDLPAAMAAAKKHNLPLFVTFRCIPCSACKGFDAEVAKGNEKVHELARTKFVALRQVEMKGVDLSQFQFDHDLNWAAMFINADGTVYARYGTQSAEGPDAYNSMPSLEATMRRVLALHEAYPSNRSELTGKRGEDKPYKTALDMPAMENKDKLRGPTARNNCIHCHNIHDAEQFQWQRQGTYTREKLYRYPLPENVGLHIGRDHGRRVERVDAGGPAAAAGLKPGDEITHADGQAITSIADIQWVLHHKPAGDTQVTFAVLRDGQRVERTVKLAKGWKQIDFTWRGSMWSLRPRPGFWAPQANEGELKRLGLDEDRQVLRIQWINRNIPAGREVFNDGLREGDFIVELDGKPLNMTPKDFQVHVRLNHKAGDTLTYTVVRGGKRVEVKSKLSAD
jgi:hypothetical protein